MLRTGPSPMGSEGYGRPDLYYIRPQDRPLRTENIILERGPFPPLAPGPNVHRCATVARLSKTGVEGQLVAPEAAVMGKASKGDS